MEAKDPYTAGHAERVARYALLGARELGAGEEELRDLHMGALLHDVGKLRIPAEIINKPSRLSAEERAVVETHTIEGERMLSTVGGASSGWISPRVLRKGAQWRSSVKGDTGITHS